MKPTYFHCLYWELIRQQQQREEMYGVTSAQTGTTRKTSLPHPQTKAHYV